MMQFLNNMNVLFSIITKNKVTLIVMIILNNISERIK